MEILLETDERWDSDRGGVMFWASADGSDIRCIVSREAIEDSFGGSGSKDETLRLFQENRAAIETEAAALIHRGEVNEVVGEKFAEVKILSSRIRHRLVAYPTRRVTADELAGSGVEKHASSVQWWSEAAKVPEEKVVITSSASKFLSVDIGFDSEDSARNFDYRMSKFGVRTFRIVPAAV